MKAGFASADITPPPGSAKIGWMADLRGDVILDPLYAHAAVFEHSGVRIGFLQLDTLCIRWTQVERIRAGIEQTFGFPGAHVMIGATHNHAGPAVASVAPVPRDDAYLQWLEAECIACFGRAIDAMRDAEMGFASRKNFTVAHNRRCRMRDGTVRTQRGAAQDPLFLCLEGPRDPEVAVLAARDGNGELMGCMVNFACHPTHHGGTHEFSAGFPGGLAHHLREAGCPVTLFLNGAYGNVITVDFERGISLGKEEAGASLAADALDAIRSMSFTDDWPLYADQETLHLDLRSITEDERRGTVFGAQRFRDDTLYNGAIEGLRERAETRRMQPAEVQLLGIGDLRFIGIPAEYFVEYQLDIKEAAYPLHALVVGGANGMIGYVPTRAAFERGGYETTLGPPSRMAPDTGDRLAAAALELIRESPPARQGTMSLRR